MFNSQILEYSAKSSEEEVRDDSAEGSGVEVRDGAAGRTDEAGEPNEDGDEKL